MTFIAKKKKPCTEHHSFWLHPETMRYIRNTSNATRIPQGQILQIIIDYFRLTRLASLRELKAEELDKLDQVKVFLRIMPI